MFKLKPYFPQDCVKILDSGDFITFNLNESETDTYPKFIIAYKKDNDKINVYSLVDKKIVGKYSVDEFYNEIECGYNGFEYLSLKGDPLEFFRYIDSKELHNYYEDVCRRNFNEILMPEYFSKDIVDKYLNDLSKKYNDFLYNNSLSKGFRNIKNQQYITWGISIASLLLSFYNIFFK